MSQKLIFIIGGGPRIGFSVARAFKEGGWKAVVASRHPDTEVLKDEGINTVSCDVSSPLSVSDAFEVVICQHGVPDVVVYNAAALTFADARDPFAIEPDAFVKDLEVNLIGAYATLHQTTKAWPTQPVSDEKGRVFIATGNVTPFQPVAMAMTLGSGKAALVHLIEIGNKVYSENGWRFYFASQVTKEGGPVPYHDVDGGKHGEVFMKLVEDTTKFEGMDWDVRFLA